MERTKKTWGEKWNFFQNDLCEVSHLKLEPWQRCSWHKHISKFNLFYVLHGKLFMKLEDGECLCEPGQIFTTSPNEWHEFRTREDGAEIIEVMYVKYDPHDIERKLVGGSLRPDYFGVNDE